MEISLQEEKRDCIDLYFKVVKAFVVVLVHTFKISFNFLYKINDVRIHQDKSEFIKIFAPSLQSPLFVDKAHSLQRAI